MPSRKSLLSVPHSRPNALQFIHDFIETHEVAGKKVIDLSAGTGYVADLWYQAGATVEAYDKYPELFKPAEILCNPIDLDKTFPIKSNAADFVLLMETIEHIPNQLFLLEEISRILKPNGLLILTKPNNSNVSGRLANFWLEAERSDMFLPNETAIIGYDDNRRYNPRFFLCGVQKLRSLAAVNQLSIEKIYPNQLSVSSLAWFLPFSIFFYFRSFLTYKKLLRKTNSQTERDALQQQYSLNSNPTVLFHKHLCITFRKVSNS